VQDEPRGERILLLDDADLAAQRVRRLLVRLGFQVQVTATVREALALIDEVGTDAIVASLELRSDPGVSALDRLRAHGSGLPVIALTEGPSVHGAVEALHHDAADYLEKPVQPDRLERALDAALARARTERDLEAARRQVADRYGFSHMLTRSPRMLAVFDQVRAVAPTGASVLIRGETGTGKELISQAIHSRSQRKERAFVSINCGAFTETLLESELFGHERGSFTGAVGRRQGVFEMADGGTLFLDELGETSLNVQVNLLRVLEEMSFRRVGGTDSVHVDVRIVAATNVALERAVSDGAFRQDLYYRLDVFPILLPPLRERPEDIPLLMRHFLDDAGREYDKDPPIVTQDAMACILAHRWPGNVRQLRALCERWVITHAGRRLEQDHLPPHMTGASTVGGHGALSIDERLTMGENTSRATREIERAYLHRLLGRHRGHMENTAGAAGITRRTLYTKMKQYALRAEDYRS